MTALNSIVTHQLNPVELGELLILWNNEFPAQINYQSVEELKAYLGDLSQLKHHLLKDKQGQIQGWLWLFERDGLPWFAMLLSRKIQRQGWGKKLMLWAQDESSFLNGWVVDHLNYNKADGSPYPSPLSFYIALGFRLSKNRLDVEKLSVAHISWP